MRRRGVDVLGARWVKKFKSATCLQRKRVMRNHSCVSLRWVVAEGEKCHTGAHKRRKFADPGRVLARSTISDGRKVCAGCRLTTLRRLLAEGSPRARSGTAPLGSRRSGQCLFEIRAENPQGGERLQCVTDSSNTRRQEAAPDSATPVCSGPHRRPVWQSSGGNAPFEHLCCWACRGAAVRSGRNP